jgi:hypothetical protein
MTIAVELADQTQVYRGFPALYALSFWDIEGDRGCNT